MNLHYQIDGPLDAPVIVLSNSLGTSLSLWDPQLDALTQQFRVLRYDTHGHGQTEKRSKVTLAQLGDDLITLLDHLNIPRAHFCGISMGGLTGLWLARFAPERFLSVTVANTAAKIGEQSAWLSRARTVREEGMDVVAAGSAERWFSREFRQYQPETVEQLVHSLARSDAEGYAQCCEALAAADLRAEAAAISVPMLIVAGEYDPVTTVDDAHFLHQQIASSQLITLPASHLSNVEAAGAFTQSLVTFIRGLNGR